MSPFFKYTARLPEHAPDAPALEARALAVAHPGARRPALSGLAFSVPQGCRAALIGANGSGKSTLLKTLAGLMPAASGEALVLGGPARPGRPELAYLAQRAAIEWHFPVSVEKLVLAGRFPDCGWFRRPSSADRDMAREALARLRLEDLAERPVHALSGGQQQRVLLARALCQDARVLLLDEPYTGLDAASRDIMESILFGDGSDALTVLMATHEPQEATARFDLILAARDGRLETLHACTCKRPR